MSIIRTVILSLCCMRMKNPIAIQTHFQYFFLFENVRLSANHIILYHLHSDLCEYYEYYEH